jgi:Immunoglobulin-like domain of bacterial spore germination
MIRVISPAENATLTSPITITGSAHGEWFAEGSFPIELRENDGDIITTVKAQAQGEWMTADFVPFTATITYAPQLAGAPAKIVFRNANPSGEPEKALEYGIWVNL